MKFSRLTNHVVALAASLTLAAATLSAQTPIGGTVSGTLSPGVYHTTGDITVAAATTWTLVPGVIIKFTGTGHSLNVSGTLLTNGSSTTPVILTDDADDSAGGDTNANGPSSGSAGAWEGVVFGAGSGASVMTFTHIRFGGSSFISNVEIGSALSPTFNSCVIHGCFTSGMDLNGVATPTVSFCDFTGNNGSAIESAPITAVAAFSNNTASGNAGSFARVTNGAVTANLTLGAGTNINGATVIATDIGIAVGATLTLNAGVIFKFQNTGCSVNVDGTLVTNGTAGNPVVFTDDADDSAGGDTNGGGLSAGGAGAWEGLVFSTTADSSSLTRADVRYGGSSFVSNVELSNASITMSHCVIRDCFTHGMDLNVGAQPSVSNCTFQGNNGYAVQSVAIVAVPGFLSNAASSNAVNTIHVTNGAVSGVVNLIPESHLGGAIMMGDGITISGASTLTCSSGVVVKFDANSHDVTVNGTLIVNGTSGSPVVFTDDADDSAGGDTNTNGPSAGGAGAWEGMIFNAGSNASVLTHASIRYGGSSFVSNVELNSASPTVSNCTIRDCFTHAMDLNANSNPAVTNCTFTANNGYAIHNAHISAVSGFSGNTASGNQTNSLHVTSGTLASNVAINATAMVTGAILVSSDLTIPAAFTLTLNAGVVVKFRSSGCSVNTSGTLIANGSNASPVILTDDDDDVGGDTNTNGAGSAPGAASWEGVSFSAGSDASVLAHAEIRYGGSSFVSNVEISGANPTLTNCVIRNCFTHGMDLNTSARPTVTNCSFVNNNGDAVAQAEIEAIDGFTNNVAAGSAANFIRVTNAIVDTPVTIKAESCMNGAIVLSAGVLVQPTGTLTIRQGSILKVDNNGVGIVVNGAAHFLGTTYEPVVITDDADDAHGGDTNNNGPSSGSGAQWQGLTFGAGAATSTVENTLLRYCGSSFVPALTCASGGVTLRSVRADSAFSNGFVLSAVASATNLIAYACGNQGVQLTGGSFDVVHATCASNSTGIRREAAWTGVVRNSISYGNGTNFSNFGAGAQVTYSNGAFAGNDNNINVDPLFVNMPAGDLALQAASPCIDTAEPFAAFAATKDHAENSRILDSELLGIPGADMGAFEHAVWDMTVAGTTRIGTNITFTITGPAGDCTYLLGILDGTIPYSPFGILLSGAIPYVTVIPLNPVVIPVGTPVTIAVPFDPSIVGLVAGLHTLTTPPGDPTVGNFTRLYRALVRP